MILNNETTSVDTPKDLGTEIEGFETTAQLVEPNEHSAKNDADIAEKIMQEHFKKVSVGTISDVQRARLQYAIDLLITLKDEVLEKKRGALEKKECIKDKISHLKESGKVNIDEEEFRKTETSVAEFVGLLDKMIDEINRDVIFYQSLLSDNPPSHVFAYKDESDDFGDQLENRISSIKKYAKNAKRDLAISYSRYCFGFDAQIRQISYVEVVLQRAEEKANNG